MTSTDLPRSAPTAAQADPRRWWALAVIAIAQLMVVLDASIVIIALPSAQRALHISTADRQWVVTAYTLAFGGLLLLGGRIADFMGRKRMFIVGLLGFAAASALGGAAQSAAMLFGARALQGAFAALMAPAALSLITVTFTEINERARAFGVYGAIAGGGAAIGLIMGGMLTEFASWRWCLLVNVPISIVAAIAATGLVHESKAHGDTKYDVPGTVAVTGGLVSLVYAFTAATTDGWGSAVTLSCLAAAAVLLVAFVLIELRASHPLLPMRIILDRNRGGSFLASFLLGVGMLGMFLFLTYYFQGTLHYSALKAGFAFLPFSGGIIVAATVASKVLPRVGPRPMMFGGLLTGSLGMLWLTQIGATTSYAFHVLPAEIAMSLGLGFAFVPMSSTALLGAGDHDAGVASALLNASQQVGGSLGTAVLNTIFATTVAGYLAVHGASSASATQATIHGYSVGFFIAAGVILTASLVSLVCIKATRRRRSSRPTRRRPSSWRPERRPRSDGGSAGVGAVDVPVTTTLGVPAVVARGEDGVAADGALPPLLVAVEQVDGEGLAVGDGFQQAGADRIVPVPDRGLPVARPAGRHVQVDGQPAEVVEVGLRPVHQELVGVGVPSVEQGDPRAHVAQPHGQVEDPVDLLGDRPAPADPGGVTVAPQHLVDRVLAQRGKEQRPDPREHRVLGDTGRTVGRAHGRERGHRQHQGPSGGGERGDGRPVDHSRGRYWLGGRGAVACGAGWSPNGPGARTGRVPTAEDALLAPVPASSRRPGRAPPPLRGPPPAS